jgi:hypothetical protein
MNTYTWTEVTVDSFEFPKLAPFVLDNKL